MTLFPLSKAGFLLAFLMCVCLRERVGAVLDSDALRSLALEDVEPRNASAGDGDETGADDLPQGPFWTPSAAPADDEDPPRTTTAARAPVEEDAPPAPTEPRVVELPVKGVV